MKHLPQGWSETLYLFVGAICIALDALMTFGAMFSSIKLAFLAFIVVDVPLLVGMAGSGSKSMVFSSLVLLAVSAASIWSLTAFGHDIFAGLSHNQLHEDWGLLYISFNILQVVLTVMRLKQLRNLNEVTPWPQ